MGRLSVFFTVLALLAAPVANGNPVTSETGPNLVVNGGFEATSTVASSGWTTSGFIAEGFDHFVDTNPADAHSGTHSFAGGGIGAPGFISQSIPTVAGQHYNIHIWLANLSGFASDTQIQVMWDGSIVYSATDIPGFGYAEIVIDPIASSGSTLLAIGLRDDAFFLNIDDVSVRLTSATVPEPPTTVLLGLALLGFALTRRRNANRTA